MNPRFITRTMHAWLDYPVAALLIGAPFVLQLGSSAPSAKWLSVAAGVAALVLTILTDHETGVIRIIPYRFHVAVDFVVGAAFAIIPFVFGFSGIDAWYYWANAGAVLTVVALQAPEKGASNRAAHA